MPVYPAQSPLDRLLFLPGHGGHWVLPKAQTGVQGFEKVVLRGVVVMFEPGFKRRVIGKNAAESSAELRHNLEKLGLLKSGLPIHQDIEIQLRRWSTHPASDGGLPTWVQRARRNPKEY